MDMNFNTMAAVLMTVMPSMTIAPLTGDEGMSGVLIPVIIGVVLVAAFAVLTVIQKKRKQNGGGDDGEE